jgi:hypothetical protein
MGWGMTENGWTPQKSPHTLSEAKTFSGVGLGDLAMQGNFANMCLKRHDGY